MTYNRHPIGSDDHREMWEALNIRFHNMEITEQEYRHELAKLGLRATEIDAEVESNKP